MISLDDVKREPVKAFERIEREVALALTEQQERLLDVLDEIVGTMVERACPPKKHWEDWDIKGLEAAFQEQFEFPADESIRTKTDSMDIAAVLYEQAEVALKKKEQEFTSTHFLRLFRTLFLQEIDKQWLEHLSHMDHLRDGIGLRGYGQRDPKKEYKREGYDLFVQTLQNTKASVVEKLFGVQRLTEREVEQAEAQRRRQVEAREQAIQAQHPEQAGQPEAAEAPPRVVIAARHSQVAQQAALQAHARRLAALSRQAPTRGPQLAPAPSAGHATSATGGAPASRVGRPARPGPAVSEAESAAVAQARAARDGARRELPKIGRNDPCHCGSGKKYKNCHMKQDQAATNG